MMGAADLRCFLEGPYLIPRLTVWALRRGKEEGKERGRPEDGQPHEDAEMASPGEREKVMGNSCQGCPMHRSCSVA